MIIQASIFGSIRTFSTLDKARKAVSKIIIQSLSSYYRAPKKIHELYQQEKYEELIDVWNEFVQKDEILLSNSLYMARLDGTDIDVDFFSDKI